jgi:hypothetical protein
MRSSAILTVLVTIGAGLVLLAVAGSPATRRLPLAELRDKIEGGWAGQMIGVSFGGPTEFRYRGELIPEDKLPQWKPEMVEASLDQDDLYVDMTFAQVLDDKGLDATTEDFGAMFRDAGYRLWHANLAARRALKRGVPVALSGTPEYNAHANDIDFQIEADFIGLMAPGLPQASNDICLRAGRVMNYGDGLYGGMFVSAMYAAAFFEKDPRRIVEAGVAAIPPESEYAQVIRDVLQWHRQYPVNWETVWRMTNEKWDKREPCPSGALKPFNIDAKLNGAYVALGLLYGRGDFERTLIISTRAGQDSDCNPASALGVLGVVLGYRGIPEKWKSGIPAIADKKFSYTNYTFRTIVESTEKRAIALATKHGGRVENGVLHVKTQKVKPPPLEAWNDYGSPVERIAASDPRWKWAGGWKPDRDRRVSAAKGASAEIEFEGTGAIVSGPYLPSGGKAEVYLDGALDKVVDVYPDEDREKGGEAVWHKFGLKSGKHTLRLVVLGEPYPGSGGAEIAIHDLIVFR